MAEPKLTTAAKIESITALEEQYRDMLRGANEAIDQATALAEEVQAELGKEFVYRGRIYRFTHGGFFSDRVGNRDWLDSRPISIIE